MRSRFRQNYRSVGHFCYNTCITGDVIYLCCSVVHVMIFPVLVQDIELRTCVDMEAFVTVVFQSQTNKIRSI